MNPISQVCLPRSRQWGKRHPARLTLSPTLPLRSPRASKAHPMLCMQQSPPSCKGRQHKVFSPWQGASSHTHHVLWGPAPRKDLLAHSLSAPATVSWYKHRLSKAFSSCQQLGSHARGVRGTANTTREVRPAPGAKQPASPEQEQESITLTATLGGLPATFESFAEAAHCCDAPTLPQGQELEEQKGAALIPT